MHDHQVKQSQSKFHRRLCMTNPPSRPLIHFDGGGFNAEAVSGVLAGALTLAGEVLVGGADATVEGGFRGHAGLFLGTPAINIKATPFWAVCPETVVSGHVNQSMIFHLLSLVEQLQYLQRSLGPE